MKYLAKNIRYLLTLDLLTLKNEYEKKPKKNKRSLNLIKSHQNPLISPEPNNDWESWQTFNPGVVLLNNKVHFIYRAIGTDGLSRLGYAVSSDGLTIDERLPNPAYEHAVKEPKFSIYSYFSGGSWSGAEDPRLVSVEGDDSVYMTYTACDNGLRVGLTSIKINDFLNKNWKWNKPKLISPLGQIHKNWLLFPEKINGKYAILHSIKPNIQIAYVDNLEFSDDKCIESFHGGPARSDGWDKWIRGAGAPPIKTKDGWLLFYHAMDDDWSKYKVGAMLLDLNNPTKILHRSNEPILEPQESYENSGSKAGVVYASGAIVKDGNIFVYYGGADNYVCVAYTPLDKFLEKLKVNKKPILKKLKLKLKKNK